MNKTAIANNRRLLPSTSMLAAFEAASRAASFTVAARELNLTQGAISKQISALEAQLGVTLFERQHQAIALTETGKAYAKAVRSALEAIRSASLNAMTAPQCGVLNLAVLPTFGTRWLMPRLPSFLKENPNITINFSTKLSPFDFRLEDLHGAIHYGSPDWPNTEHTYLMGEEVVPVCSPRFLQEYRLQSPDDLVNAPLLHIASRPDAWHAWFRAQQLPTENCEGMYFEQFLTAAQAAVAGLGAALLPKFLVQNELDHGELVLIFEKPLRSDYGYYLITPLDKAGYRPITAFRQWLLREVASTA